MPFVRETRIGDEYLRGGRVWRAVGFEPYTRKDGSETELAVWRGYCTKCNQAFEVKTPGATILDASGSFDRKRCRACIDKSTK
ncbi:MAG: hypothetical protein BGO13_08635 [Burkholderiales bacterium 66-5]|nr:MAG: hypothetical protein BGO13_08635 [Burkholderiales bacterium 66-5]